MKKFLLMLAVMLLTCATSFAERTWLRPAAQPLQAEGVEQYFYNVEYGGFLCGANDWGTRASVALDKGLKISVTQVGMSFKLGQMSPDNADGVWVDGSRQGNDQFGFVLLENDRFNITNEKFPNTYLTWTGDEGNTRLNFTESPANGTWYSVTEEEFNRYIEEDLEKVKLYFAALPLKDLLETSSELGIDDSSERAVYNNDEATIDQINDAIASLTAKVNEAQGIYTHRIVNNTVTGATGWTCERPVGGNGPLLNGSAFEYWGGNASSRQDASFNYYQKIAGLPAGKYVLGVEMKNSSNGEGAGHEPNGNAGLYLANGEDESFVGVTEDGEDLKPYTTQEVAVKEGDEITVGVKSIGYMSARWFVADNFTLVRTGDLPAAGWDGTVTTSMDNGVVTKLADLDGMTITLPGAKSIEMIDLEEIGYLSLQNEDGMEIYGIWSPTYGGSCSIDGETITLSGFVTLDEVTTDIPATATTLYIEDYGTFIVDGVQDVRYIPTIELTANIAAPAEPFEYTVTNNGVEGDATKAVEASESGVMYQFEVKAEGKALSKGEGVPTLTLLEDATVDFGASQLVAYEAETAYVRFMTLQQPYFTQPGTYVLTIPEGTFVDAEGTPNAEATYKWVIIQGADPEPFDVVSVVNGSEAVPGNVEALSYMFSITTANAITGLGEGNITLTDADNQPVGGNAYVFGYEGEGGATTVYARFTFDSEDHQLHTPGTYTLNVPAGMFKDADGNPNNEFSATWTIKGDELEDNDITDKYIVNADLADGLNGWTAVTFNTPNKQANSGYATEAYAGWSALDVTEYSLTQKVTLPAGSYKLTNNSFFRQAGGAKDNVEKSLAYLVAGEEQVLVKTLGSIDAKAYANSHVEGAGVLSSGKAMYFNEVDFTLAEETEIEIGLKGTFDEMRSWMIASGFHLYDMSIDPAAKEDVSNLIVNNSFENGTEGWTVEGEWAEQNNGEAVKVGTRYVEKWQAAGNLPDASIMQTLTGLKNGKYILSAVAHSQGTGAFLVANDDRTEVTTPASLQSVETEVTDGTLTIGYVRDNYQGNWIAVDNFTLVYCAPATPQPEVINIETVEVGTFVDDSWQTNDVYYTATVKFKKPAGAKYAYSEGLHMEFNGENTGVPFQFGMFGMIELEEGDSVTLVYKDAMLASTEDPEYEGDFRPAGSYVGTTEITFLNEDQWEIEGVVAKFTGSIVLPALNAVEIGEPTFNIAAAQEEGVRITTGYIEANGIVMTLDEAKNITPDMQIKVVADLWQAVPTFGAEPGTMPNFQPLIEGAEFTGDAMFGLPTVAMTDFAQAAIEAGEGNIFQILVKSIEVIDATGVVASYVDDPEAEPMGCAFAVEPWIETEATAVVSATAPNQYGDEFYQVTVTIENSDNEIAAAGVAKAYTEGVQFSMYDEEHDSLITFTFACDQIEGVEVAEEEDVVLTCKDVIPAITADQEFEGEFRTEGTYQASCDVVLVDANEKELGVAKFAGELILTKSITGINGVAAKFVVKEVIYTVNGVRVNAPVKGINIVNGKKVLVK